MKFVFSLSILILHMLLAGCENDSPPQPWEGQTRALEKAQTVESTLQQSLQNRDRQLRQDGG